MTKATVDVCLHWAKICPLLMTMAVRPQTSLNRFQSLILKDAQILAAYSTASPINSPCLPSARSTSSSSYSPLMCGTLIVISISVDAFSSRSSVRMRAVKSGADDRSLELDLGVWVAMRV
jgi:hypothetical protein